MLLRFSRHQVMYGVICDKPCAEVTYKRYFSYNDKVKIKIKLWISDHSQHCFKY